MNSTRSPQFINSNAKRAGIFRAARAPCKGVAACESVNLLQEPDAADPHVRFDERDVEIEPLTPPRRVWTLPFDCPESSRDRAVGTLYVRIVAP
jgi:hypothetical protein